MYVRAPPHHYNQNNQIEIIPNKCESDFNKKEKPKNCKNKTTLTRIEHKTPQTNKRESSRKRIYK